MHWRASAGGWVADFAWTVSDRHPELRHNTSACIKHLPSAQCTVSSTCILHKYIVNTSACIKHPASAQYCVLAKIYHILTQVYNVLAEIYYELRLNNSTYIKHPPSAQCTVVWSSKIVCCGFKRQAGASWWIFTTLDDLPVLHSLSGGISSKINE